MGMVIIVAFFLVWTWIMTFLVCKKEAVSAELIVKKILRIQSPSVKAAKVADKCFVKPLCMGIKESQKLHKKYMAHRKKFERKWLKQNASWADTRQKKKALKKAFLKEFPFYSFYIKLERLGIKCKI